MIGFIEKKESDEMEEKFYTKACVADKRWENRCQKKASARDEFSVYNHHMAGIRMIYYKSR